MTLSLPALSLVFAGALGLGTGLLARNLFDLLHLYVIQSQARRWRDELTAAPVEIKPLDVAALYGVAHISWPFWYLVAGAAGFSLTMMVFSPSAELVRMTGVLAFAAPWFVRRYLMEQGRRRVQMQVRGFIADLRLALALEGSLGPTLIQAQKQGQGVLYERLGLYIQTRLTSGAGQDVLRALAGDMRSPDFDDLMFRLQAAERGAKSYEVALREAAERVALEAHSRTMRSLKAAPVRLIVPIILTIFAPTLVIAMYPLVARVIAGLGAY